MQIIELELSHTNFYCPVTGEAISKDNEMVNEAAKSLKGYWVSEILLEPFIKDNQLKKAWETLVADCEAAEEKAENEDSELDEAFILDIDRIVKFFKDYNTPTSVVFEITTSGLSHGPNSSTVWYVIEMDKY